MIDLLHSTLADLVQVLPREDEQPSKMVDIYGNSFKIKAELVYCLILSCIAHIINKL